MRVHLRLREAVRVGCCALLTAVVAVAQGPVAGFQPEFGLRGTSSVPRAACVFDDGAGPELYLGGSFDAGGSVLSRAVVKFDGAKWTAMNPPVPFTPPSDAFVNAMTVFDDGTGPALYVAGRFGALGGVAALNIARFRNGVWSDVGGGLSVEPGYLAEVKALQVHDDGTGPRLYAAGQFTLAGGAPALRLACWDGTAWSAVPSPSTLFQIQALGSFGGDLYVGAFGPLGTPGAPASSSVVAKWDGSAWSLLPFAVQAGLVRRFVAFDDGSGPQLYVGGGFDVVNGVATGGLVRFDGTSFTPVGGGLTGGASVGVTALGVTSVGGTNRLLVGGGFTAAGGAPISRAALWDGAAYSAPVPNASLNGSPEFFVDYAGRVFAAGSFATATPYPLDFSLAVWDGAAYGFADPRGAPGGYGRSGYSAPDASGRLHRAPNPIPAGTHWIERKDVGGWTPVASSPDLINPTCFATWDFGAGPELVVGGRFGTTSSWASNNPSALIRRQSGSALVDVGAGLLPISVASKLTDLEVGDLGSGPRLFATGGIASSGGTPMNAVAAWDGVGWSALGAGLNGVAHDALVFDDGGGAALYVCGEFTTADGIPAARIAKWDGAQWSALGSGLDGNAYSLTVHDDGSGPSLHVGGRFATAGGVPAPWGARWRNGAWSAVSAGVVGGGLEVRSLASFDDGAGGGAKLFAGGSFVATAGAAAAGGLARLDGGVWVGVPGLTYPPGVFGEPVVTRITARYDADGASLVVEGSMPIAGGHYVVGVARYGLPRPAARLEQPAAGAGVSLACTGWTGGRDYLNVFSAEPGGAAGAGPYFGLWASDPTPLVAQVLVPAGFEPFRPIATGGSYAFGPVALPVGLSLDVVTLDVTPGFVCAASYASRLVVQ
jgi:hypothetical protein